MLSCNDVIFAILEAHGGKIEGRTMLQKVGYFVGVETETELGYQAHFYGPYSPLIAATMGESVAMGTVMETPRSAANRFTGHDGSQRTYCYELTEAGKRAAGIHREWHEVDYDNAKRVASDIRATGANILQLSFAAKVHYIISNQDEPEMEISEVTRIAKTLGWKLDEADVSKGATVLQDLNYIV